MTRRAGRLATRAVAAVTGTVALTRLGLPALILVLAAVLIMAVVVCWVLADNQRSINAEKLIRAARPAPPLAPTTSARPGPPPAKPWWIRRRKGAGHG